MLNGLGSRRVGPARGVAAALALAVVVGACAPEISARGNEPTRERLSQIQAGEQSRAEVAALLGTPSTTATFDDETWYYISAQTQQFAIYEREELERRVIAISFGDDGRVSDVRELTLDDGREVEVVDRETPTLGNELSVLEQLLGNLGRFEGGEGGLNQTIDGL
ncbi:outer membrane protein assembly factor BamE [Roseospira goensis]|uniref:Outer membrane protein assembly factor BamE (Lipoprotein component of BamABCDE complex) n=1 Tax=Roseospira goensis TaxID=391922 RepID=A0A7W6WL71_9PROT|nr:outer membrane protein assembly factor BamE [Roseospira goensis]MBB4286845.1 outer membrane protein assembly factor BamE (lipoprotein component of BamABCDE complex) [Roseospira goensis]